MALPPQAIERLSREPAGTPGWSSRLLMFSATLLFLAVFGYVGLEFGYRPVLQSQIQKKESDLSKLSQQIPAGDQDKIVAFYSQLSNLKKVLGEHTLATELFSILEKNTQANVYFTRFAYNAKNQQVVLTGVAKSVEDAAEQVLIFEQQPEFSAVAFNNVSSLPSGQWQFDTQLTLASGVLLKSDVAAPAPAATSPAATSTSTATSSQQ